MAAYYVKKKKKSSPSWIKLPFSFLAWQQSYILTQNIKKQKKNGQKYHF
jgi:hypothetical protein